jgi:hypothetical protein
MDMVMETAMLTRRKENKRLPLNQYNGLLDRASIGWVSANWRRLTLKPGPFDQL